MNRWRSALLLVAFWFVAMLGPAHSLLLQGRQLAFRDAGHYYPPYLRMIQNGWSDGPPLWNHFEERGRPLLADPTAGVLYPGSLLFLLPVRFEVLWPTYLLAHLFIAAAGSYRMARQCSFHPASAALASLGYAFGGHVLFQVHNLPYLLGAAWLPWALAEAIRLLEKPRASAVAGLAVFWALIVLAGDLQTAYLAGLASLFAWVCFAQRSPHRFGSLSADPRSGHPAASRLAMLLGGLTLGLALSTVQWLPTWYWSQQSARWTLDARVEGNSPTPADASQEDAASEIVAAELRYDYSVGPWRWLELFLPNASGHFTPSLTRWSTALPCESRAWTPSLYMGLLVAGLALLAMRRPAIADWRRRWLVWLTLFGIAGSLGRYGLLWLLHRGGTGQPLFDAQGGLYWALLEFLPGFHVFRYPAKLWTWTSFGASLLAAGELQRWLDLATADSIDRSPAQVAATRLRGVLAVASLACGCVLWSLAAPGGYLVQATPPDALFGALDAPALRSLVLESVLHSLLICLAWHVWQRRWLQHHAWSGWAMVAITAVDLAVAHRGLLPTVPADTLPALSVFHAERAAADSPSPPRYLRVPAGTWYPAAWSRSSSPERLQACVLWDAATLRPKHHLDERLCSLRSSTSFSSKPQLGQLALLDQLFTQHDPAWVELLRVLGCEFVVIPTGQDWPDLPTRCRLGTTRDARIASIPDPYPRAWVVHRSCPSHPAANALPADASRDSIAAWQHRLHQTWILQQRMSQFRTTVFLEQVGDANLDSASPPREDEPAFESPAGDSATCRLLRQSARSLTLQVNTQRPGWLVLNDSHDADWRARMIQGTESWDSPVRRANDVMMAVEVPAGETRVEWEYHPTGFEAGQRVTWAALLVLVVVAWADYRKAAQPAGGI